MVVRLAIGGQYRISCSRYVANSIRSRTVRLCFTFLSRYLIISLLFISLIYNFILSIAFFPNFSLSIIINIGIICAQLSLLHLQSTLLLLPESSRNVVTKFQPPGLGCRDKSYHLSYFRNP